MDTVALRIIVGIITTTLFSTSCVAIENRTRPDQVMAINILLEPDENMIRHVTENNALLRKAYPEGFSLDAAHTPHMTLVQCFVRSKDLKKVYAGVKKALGRTHVKAIQLEAYKYYYYVPSGPIGLAGIVARPTTELLKLQADIVASVAPYTVDIGDSSSFITTKEDPVIDPVLIRYVATFVSNQTGEHFSPHVSTGVALKEDLDELLARPFQKFTFYPTGAAVYQIGQLGAAATKLQGLKLQQ
ncbi:MAG: hypothetical protein Q7T36_14325 [Fluviicoccus sp.]|uniref:hypothetical protein n=1 Tax=Fluviicoccus sp. TaxID=2003552 RepID=UPI00271EB212|nr:hypothetical protein [Fluviicoccus sp.]MDO8331638.1 hypothetical protein [Fluviicoccus sp.]